MSPWRYLVSWPVLLTFMAGATARQAWGQARYAPRYQEPQWFTFHLSQVSAGVYGEANYQENSYDATGMRVKYLRTFIGPSLGLIGSGSIYHPNLARYYLNTDGAFGWARDDVSGDASSKSEEYLYLGNASVTLDLLPEKDYRGSVYASYNNNYRDDDFFSRLMVETWRVGGRVNWDTGPLQLSASYDHFDETSASRYPVSFAVPPGSPPPGTDLQSTLVEDVFDARIRHERDAGGTVLSYIFTRFDRSDPGQTGVGEIQTVSLGDAENFGDHHQHHLNADASYTHRDTLFEISDEVLAKLSLSLEHRPNLDSFYDFYYDHFEVDPFVSDSISGAAQLNHKLYESLTSSVRATASDYEVTDEQSDGYTRRYGVGLSENYTKNLSAEHKLSLGASVFVEHTDQQAINTIENERHQVQLGGENGAPGDYQFFLNFPNVDQLSIAITDSAGTIVYLAGWDYWVTSFGDRTLIEWNVAGAGLPPLGQVVVDYEINPLPGGEYNSLTQGYYARLDLWRNLLGVYGRVSLYDNNADAEQQILEYTTYSAGLEFNWRWFRAGIEYQLYDSTESDYRSIRMFQSGMWRPDDVSTFSLDFSEAWISYVDSDRQEEDYRAITRYHRVLTRRLGLDLDAGVSYQQGQGVDQLLTAFRPSIRYAIGKTTINVGYEFEYDIFVNQEERMKNLLYVRLRRIF
jgi:hypothetical protein